MEEKFLIPIDNAIKDFKHHLDAHDRTILSARFGDGKSFFLSHFVENDDVAKRYTFLTIFPVNYQVIENSDIFELIKRDILLQMLLKGIIETDVEISDEVALALHLQNKSLDFAESFLPLLSDLSFNEDAAKTISAALAGKTLFKTIKQKLDNLKNQSRDSQLVSFFNYVEQNPIVGQDAISYIIQKCLQQYKDKYPEKRVVLVIEDLDRIDPAHLFRILNIFSAHIDFCYRLGDQPDKTLAGNKFGLDKVIFVMDYDNVGKIYSHFYGVDTSFNGYIKKFCSSNYFKFSLSEERNVYYKKLIANETQLPDNLLDYLIRPSDFNDPSVRTVVNAINNTDDFIINKITTRTREGKVVPLHQGILRLVAILRKLGLPDSDIVKRIKSAIETKNATTNRIFDFIGPYICFINLKNTIGEFRYIQFTNVANYVKIISCRDDGTANCEFSIMMNDDVNVVSKLDKTLNKIVKMVSK